MDQLLIPFALTNENEIISPGKARKGGSFFCPACRSELVLKRGSFRTPHFAHKHDVTCSQETIIHKTAKKVIVQVIRDWKNRKGKAPVIQRECAGCKTPVTQRVPDIVDRASEEVRIGNYIADLVLFGNDTPLAAIEICVTHAVEDKKKIDMTIPFIEIDGYELLRKPLRWHPTFDKFKPILCDSCKSKYKKYTEIAKRTNVNYNENYYTPAAVVCYKCKVDILVFTWPNHGVFPQDKPDQEPMPRTIQLRFSKTFKGKYWANTCPKCGAIQGDFFLFENRKGPFY